MATLELYLIRHGVAAERGEEYPDDSKRPLTSDGIARLRKEAKALDALDVSFDQILVEPARPHPADRRRLCRDHEVEAAGRRRATR